MLAVIFDINNLKIPNNIELMYNADTPDNLLVQKSAHINSVI